LQYEDCMTNTEKMLKNQMPNILELEWKVTDSLIVYPEALAFMEQRVAGIRAGSESECIWLLEHPPLYTAGTSAKASDLLSQRFPVYDAGRGGEYTYHGPGQRVGYIMLDLKKRYAPNTPDIRDFVKTLEQWVIASLSEFGVNAFTREGRIGVWVQTPTGGEAKIAAQGIRIRHGVSYHGIAINVHPNLTHFAGIVPCGIREFGVTSLHTLGKNVSLAELDTALMKHCPFV
jgi:lipoyl(octanoyl) transferase